MADQPPEVNVGVFQHGGVGRLESGEQSAFVVAVVGPGLHPVVAVRKSGPGRDDAELQLALQPLLSGGVPAFGKDLVVLVDQFPRRLMRGMAGPGAHHEKPRHVGGGRLVTFEERHCLSDQILGQVVSALVGAGGGDMGVVPNQLGGVLVGFGVEEAVVAIEATAQRPAVERAAWPCLGKPGGVPLAHQVVAIADRPQRFGQCGCVGGDLAPVAGEAGIEVGQATHTDVMVVASGQKSSPGGGAHGGGVKTGVAKTIGGEAVNNGGIDFRAVATEVGEADIVKQDDHQVLGVRGGPRRPVGY